MFPLCPPLCKKCIHGGPGNAGRANTRTRRGALQIDTRMTMWYGRHDRETVVERVVRVVLSSLQYKMHEILAGVKYLLFSGLPALGWEQAAQRASTCCQSKNGRVILSPRRPTALSAKSWPSCSAKLGRHREDRSVAQRLNDRVLMSANQLLILAPQE